MKKNIFYKMVEEIVGSHHYIDVKSKSGWESRYFDNYIEKGEIISKVKTGGYSGGNCWGDAAEEFSTNVTNVSQGIEDILALIAEKACPDISYIKFRNISKLVEQDTKTEYEYYGNSDDYHICKINIEKLHEAIFN